MKQDLPEGINLTRTIYFSSERSQHYIDPIYPPNSIIPKVEFFTDLIPNFIYVLFTRVSFLYYLGFFIAQLSIDSFPFSYSITLVPIIFTISFILIEEIFQFYRRKKLIKQIDRRKAIVLRENEWIEIPWQAVAVGDLLKMSNGDVSPADLVLLATTNGGATAIDTYLIDGSNHLKARNPPRGLNLLKRNNLEGINIELNCNKNEHETFLAKVQFEGKISWLEGDSIKEANISSSQFIERYSTTYQMGDIICGVVFTGRDCRTVNKITRERTKFTNLEKSLNIFNFGMLIYIIILASGLSWFSFYYDNVSSRWPFNEELTKLPFFLSRFKNFMGLFLPFLPIEFYWAINIILLIHSLFIQSDKETIVPSIYAIDELPQIDTIVSSKSLLLDKGINVMRMYVNGKIYGKSITLCEMSKHGEAIDYVRLSNMPFEEDSLFPDKDTYLFFLHLAICHSAIPILVDNYIGYVSNYLEDEPMIKIASQYGFVFVRRLVKQIGVIINEKPEVFNIKIQFPFSNKHPRVSMLFDDLDGTTKMFIKGEYDYMHDYVDVPNEIISKFKKEGLRVICLSYKIFTPEDVARFNNECRNAKTASDDYIFELINRYEKNGTLLGLIGFEHQPRAGTLHLINSIKKANIQFVMASPEPIQTLQTFAISTGIIGDTNKIYSISGDTVSDVKASVDEIIKDKEFNNSLILDNSSIDFLDYVNDSEKIINNSKIIIIEKAIPEKVAEFIDYLKHKTKRTVMAIGNSVFDTIYMQNSNLSVSFKLDLVTPSSYTSDIVTKNLDSLRTIIFLHGGLIRERISFFFHHGILHNFIIGYILLFYSFFTALSGTPLFNEYQILSSLMFFSMIPLLSRSIFNQKFPQTLLKNSPEYYHTSRVKKFSFSKIILANLISIFFAIIIIGSVRIFLNNSRSPYGESFSYVQISYAGHTFFTVISIFLIVPYCQTWNKFHYINTWGSLILYFIITRINTDSENAGQRRGIANHTNSNFCFILLLIFFIGFSFYLSLGSALIMKAFEKHISKKAYNQNELSRPIEFSSI